LNKFTFVILNKDLSLKTKKLVVYGGNIFAGKKELAQ